MAVWYCGSVQYAAVTQWAATTAYVVGDLRRQLAAPAVDSERVFRCTTAGTSGGAEPTWTITKGGTTNDGSVVWTEVTGNSTYAWNAPFATMRTPSTGNWVAAGDTVYVASNHNPTIAAVQTNVWPGTFAAPNIVLCVNAAGSVPPVSADITTGATETVSSASAFQVRGKAYIYGITYVLSGAGDFSIGNSTISALTFDNCKFRITNNSARSLNLGTTTAAFPTTIVWNNTTLEFGNASSGIYLIGGSFQWQNTASAIVSGTLPTALFPGSATEGVGWVTLDGVDLSALGSGKTIVGASSGRRFYSLINCRLGSSVTVASTPTQYGNRVEVINCDSGATGYRNEIYDYSGTLTAETTIIRTAGASDGVQAVSWKIVTTANCSRVFPFRAWPIPMWNTATGGSKTATVEMVNDGTTLKDSEAALDVAYLGSSSYPLASRVTTAAADMLNAGSNIATSTEAWTTTGLSSPVKQKMAAAFTPNMAGLVRGCVVISKASQTLYVDPKISPLT